MAERRKCVSASQLAASAGVPLPHVAAVFSTVLRYVRSGETVTVRGFGRFYPATSQAGRRVMPDLSIVEFPEKQTIKLRPSAKAKEVLTRKSAGKRKQNGSTKKRSLR